MHPLPVSLLTTRKTRPTCFCILSITLAKTSNTIVRAIRRSSLLFVIRFLDAFHGSDEIFLFETEPKFLETRRDRNWQTDRRVTEIFADLIVHFARTG
jgi:hypothetical protein